MSRPFLLLVLLLWVRAGFAQPARDPLGHHRVEATPEPPPDGETLMRRVRAQLPMMPLRMSGFIRTRDDRGERDRRLTSELRFGDPLPRGTYTLADRFGTPVTKVRVGWPLGEPVFQQWDAEGEPLPAPEPSDEVADTGLTWSDLSLSFLWWPGAEVEGRDRVKARTAHVVRLPAPPGREDLDAVKLWVDQKALFIVRADLLDSAGDVLKRIEVESIKKIREDFWMVKDLKIRDYAGERRIGIRFEEVEEMGE